MKEFGYMKLYVASATGGERTPYILINCIIVSFLQFISTEHPTAIKDQIIRFSFIDSKTGYIELLLQDSDICHGWYIEPHMEPLKVNNECLKPFHVMMNIVNNLVNHCECYR